MLGFLNYMKLILESESTTIEGSIEEKNLSLSEFIDQLLKPALKHWGYTKEEIDSLIIKNKND